jgi:hypothetical protein
MALPGKWVAGVSFSTAVTLLKAAASVFTVVENVFTAVAIVITAATDGRLARLA